MATIVLSFVFGLIPGAAIVAWLSRRAALTSLVGLIAGNLLLVAVIWTVFRTIPTTGEISSTWLILWLYVVPAILWPLSAGLALGGLSAVAMGAWRGP